MDVWLCLLPLLGLGLDALLGDPRGWPHPVRWIGWVLNRLESKARLWAGAGGATGADVIEDVAKTASAKRLRLAGIAAVLLVAGGASALVWLLSCLPGLGWLVTLYFAYAGLALRGLVHEVNQARLALSHEGIEAGRLAVSGLVSRDVSGAGEDDLYRALAETLAENFNDAVIAPFFWLCLAGPVGLWVYKAVSTMDSMWGYKTERWRDLGWAAARLDDALAWIPARISAVVLRFTPFGDAVGSWPGWAVVGMQARKMASPNAGWPMTAAAWLHGQTMGGPTAYNGAVVEKPLLGPENAPAWNGASLEDLLRHTRRAGIVGSIALWLVVTLIALFI